jgi:outer membrane biosynthesis protein TonB
MTSSALENPVSRNLAELWTVAEPHEGRIAIAALLAVAAHVGFGLWAPDHAASPRPLLPPVEVEIALREPPPPPPVPEEVAPPAPAAPPTPVRAAVPKAAPPPAAKAAAVMTAAPTAPEPQANDEPFDFTSDPTSTTLSSGVVAVGGTGTHGLAGAQLGGRGTEPARAPAQGDGLTAAGDLSQSPRLRAQDPCRGFFPSSARDDVATAVVRVVVTQQGVASSVSVVSETPLGQGFGAAARTCMREQRFLPALDRQGRPAATAVNVNVKFSR